MADNNTVYLKLITSEHATSVNFLKYVKATLDMNSPIVDVLNEFNTLFNLNVATGIQLDDIGSLVGISRTLPIDNADIDPVLNDAAYRKVIRAKILKNHWDGTMQGMQTILSTLYPGLPCDIIDNQDMTMTVYINDPTISAQDKALLFNGFILPKPSGVGVNYQIVEKPIFSWDLDTTYFKGWDEGTWS